MIFAASAAGALIADIARFAKVGHRLTGCFHAHSDAVLTGKNLQALLATGTFGGAGTGRTQFATGFLLTIGCTMQTCGAGQRIATDFTEIFACFFVFADPKRLPLNTAAEIHADLAVFALVFVQRVTEFSTSSLAIVVDAKRISLTTDLAVTGFAFHRTFTSLVSTDTTVGAIVVAGTGTETTAIKAASGLAIFRLAALLGGCVFATTAVVVTKVPTTTVFVFFAGDDTTDLASQVTGCITGFALVVFGAFGRWRRLCRLTFASLIVAEPLTGAVAATIGVGGTGNVFTFACGGIAGRTTGAVGDAFAGVRFDGGRLDVTLPSNTAFLIRTFLIACTGKSVERERLKKTTTHPK